MSESSSRFHKEMSIIELVRVGPNPDGEDSGRRGEDFMDEKVPFHFQ